MDFVGQYNVFPVRSCAFPGVPACSCVFYMHPNWRLLDIICLHYGLELSFVVDLPITCVPNVTALNRTWSDVGQLQMGT